MITTTSKFVEAYSMGDMLLAISPVRASCTYVAWKYNCLLNTIEKDTKESCKRRVPVTQLLVQNSELALYSQSGLLWLLPAKHAENLYRSKPFWCMLSF